MAVGYEASDNVKLRVSAYAEKKARETDASTWGAIWQVCADGLRAGQPYTQMIDAVVRLGLSQDAASAAVRHVLAEANCMAALQALFEARDSGADVRKIWLPGSDPCHICRKNAAQGPVALENAFSSGHMAPPGHLGCQCTISASLNVSRGTGSE